MDREELIGQYKALPILVRVGIAFLLPVLILGLLYWGDIDKADSEKTAALEGKKAAENKFNEAKNKKKQVPKLLEQKQTVDEQLKKARLKLPESIDIADALQKTATIGKETEIDLTSFVPADEQKKGNVYFYIEQPIALEFRGSYSKVASFLDRLSHLTNMVQIRRVEMKGEIENGKRGSSTLPQDTQSYFFAKEQRSKTRVATKVNLVMFRSLNSSEGSDFTPPEEPAAEKAPEEQAPKSVKNEQRGGNGDDD